MIHCRMMMHPYAKYRMPMAKNKEFMARTRIHVKKLIFLISRSKVKVIQRSSIYMTHRLIVIHPYAKYGMPTSKNKEVMARTRIHVKKLIFLILRSTVKVINIRDTSSHSDTTICQIWYAYLKEQRSYDPDTNLHKQTDGRTE